MSGHLSIIRRRRGELARRLRPASNLEALEESCVPSYCHPNPMAAGIAWWRLLVVAALCRRRPGLGPVLDFGAGTGEIAHLLGVVEGGPAARPYHFVETDENLAAALREWNPSARREQLDRLPRGRFAIVLALDSLEHNDDVTDMVRRLAESLDDDGVLILSGPTESAWYRLGRRIAGFSGHYHKQTVYDVEAAAASVLELARVVKVPRLFTLFRISVWRVRA
jgi:SAM-dependent methyltransferase